MPKEVKSWSDLLDSWSLGNIKVQVPEGKGAGDEVEISHPTTGKRYSLTVPEDMRAGEEFDAEFEIDDKPEEDEDDGAPVPEEEDEQEDDAAPEEEDEQEDDVAPEEEDEQEDDAALEEEEDASVGVASGASAGAASASASDVTPDAPSAKFFRCTNHRRDNISEKFTQAHVDAYVYTTKATTMDELRERKALHAEVPTRAEEFVAYIDKLPDHEQFPTAHMERAGHSMRGQTTEQSCESMNAAHNGVRQMSPTHALLYFAKEDLERATITRERAMRAEADDKDLTGTHRVKMYGTVNKQKCMDGTWKKLETKQARASVLYRSLGRVRAKYKYSQDGDTHLFCGHALGEIAIEGLV